MQIAQQLQGQSVLNLEEFVHEATWKDLLIDLVKKNEIDPWNVDIIEVVDRYIDAIKGMRILDLRVPANIILAASILLRLKSELVRFDEEAEQAAEERAERQEVSVDNLVYRIRLAPKKRVSLAELIAALEEAMKIKEERISKAARSAFEIPIMINASDIEKDIDNVYAAIKKGAGKSKMITFTELMHICDVDDVLMGLFIPLLFLEHKNKVVLTQERFFEEIIIALAG